MEERDPPQLGLLRRHRHRRRKPALHRSVPRPRPQLPRPLRAPTPPHHLRLARESAQPLALRRATCEGDHAPDEPLTHRQLHARARAVQHPGLPEHAPNRWLHHGHRPIAFGDEQLRPGVGHPERLRHRRRTLPAEPGRQPHRHRRRRDLPRGRRDPRPILQVAGRAADMSAVAHRAALSRRATALAWFAVAAPPLAWALQLLVGYGIEEAACSPGGGPTGRPDASRPATAVVTAAGVVVAVLAVLASARTLRATRAGQVDDPRGRVAFMALAGIAGGLLFGALILLSLIAVITLD